jgi:hypothetical protein
MILRLLFLVALLCPVCARAQSALSLLPFNGSDPNVDGTLNGWTVADQFGTSQYAGYVGHLGVIFQDQAAFADVSGTPRGSFRGDAGGAYAGQLGLVAFCIDSETSFRGTSNQAPQNYVPNQAYTAEARYLDEGVSGYGTGGLLKAAYLLETFYDQAMSLGDLGAATLQAAIWEVLTDSTPNLAIGNGNYFLRNNTGNATQNNRANQMITQSNSWFSTALANNWGGSSYNPGDRVVFWLDSSATSANQSIITLNPYHNGAGIIAVPEPSVLVMLLPAVAIACRRRRPPSQYSQG